MTNRPDNNAIEVTTADPVRRSQIANHLCDLAEAIDPHAKCIILPWDGSSSVIFTASSAELRARIVVAMKKALETQ
ncbi:MAG TPA: hypothetical protein VIE65_00730 [Methylobacter sp.]